MFKRFSFSLELFFTLRVWLFIVIIYLSFIWLYNTSLSFWGWMMPVFFLISMYIGYALNGKYYVVTDQITVKRKINFLILSLIGLVPVLLLFLERGSFDKNISDLRDDHFDQGVAANFKDTMLTFMFPLVIISFILVNFNNLRHKKLVNLIAVIASLLSTRINGGRDLFLVFGMLFVSIYFFKNFNKLKQKAGSYIIKGFLLFIAICIAATVFSTMRTNKENDVLLNYMMKLKYLNSSALVSLNSYKYGFALILLIVTIYDYTGANLSHLDIYLSNVDKVDKTFGFYQFNFLDRLHLINIKQVHDLVDSFYVNYGIYNNVWATSLRDMMIEFGLIGSFMSIVILSWLLFFAKKYIHKSYSAQVVYIMTLSFFIFSPFHSIFYINRVFAFTFAAAIFMFLRFLFFNKKVFE